MDDVMHGALEDITIVDLSRVLAGPYATQLLGDLGARVIKVEEPGRGDDTRRWGPPFTDNGESAYFFAANRNKQSMTLDLKHPAGQEVLHALVAKADVVVENFKVGTMKKFGADYSSLHEINTSMILCSITGYGQTGPYRDRPGYDTAIQAQGGIMSITGPAEGDPNAGAPYKVGVAITDITTGLYAATAILAALHHRNRSGQGQHIDIALFDTQLSWLANVASAYLQSGSPPQRQGNAHASIVPYQTIETADGWLMLAVGNDTQFRALCEQIGRPELANEPRFATNPARVAHRTELLPHLQAAFRRRTTADWLTVLLQANVPCSPVNDIPTALADPQAQARDMVQTIIHPRTGPITLLGPVPKMSATPAVIAAPPPRLGEHTELVLSQFLGYSAAQIARLRNEGAI